MSVSADSQVAVLNLRTGERRVLFEGCPVSGYTPTGHLVYEREGALLAAPFDPDLLRLTASPVRVLEGVSGFRGIREHALSHSGVLAYVPGGGQARDRTLVWVVDRQGAAQPVAAPPRQYSQIRLFVTFRGSAAASGRNTSRKQAQQACALQESALSPIQRILSARIDNSPYALIDSGRCLS
jgi:hypothetical protein